MFLCTSMRRMRVEDECETAAISIVVGSLKVEMHHIGIQTLVCVNQCCRLMSTNVNQSCGLMSKRASGTKAVVGNKTCFLQCFLATKGSVVA